MSQRKLKRIHAKQQISIKITAKIQRSEKHNVFTEEVNNTRIQSIDSIETYAYGTSKNLVCSY